jgi:hypothetical protein
MKYHVYIVKYNGKCSGSSVASISILSGGHFTTKLGWLPQNQAFSYRHVPAAGAV